MFALGADPEDLLINLHHGVPFRDTIEVIDASGTATPTDGLTARLEIGDVVWEAVGGPDGRFTWNEPAASVDAVPLDMTAARLVVTDGANAEVWAAGWAVRK